MTTETAALVEHVIGRDGTFSLHVRTSDIRLRATDGDTVHIRARDGGDLRQLETERGDGLLVARAGGGCPDLDIDLPVAASVVVEGASADLDIQGLRGDQRYRTASGDVDVRDGGGRLTIDAVSGDVDIIAAVPAQVVARTVSGDLALRAGAIDALRATTTSGDLRIAGRFAGAGPFAIETVSGDAILAPVEGLRILVTTITGDVRTEDGARAEGPRGRRTVVIGSGGPDLTFRSTSGDLRVVPAMPLASRSSSGPDSPPLVLAPEPPSAPPPPAAAGTPVDPIGDGDDRRLVILRALERGEIDVAEATRQLEDLDDASARPSDTETDDGR
jgi:hypothetical protein